MPQKLARGFQMIFWGLIFVIIDISPVAYFTTSPVKFDIFPDIVGVVLTLLGSLFLFSQRWYFTIAFLKRYTISVGMLLFCASLWFIYTLLKYLSLTDNWGMFVNVGSFGAPLILYTALIFVGYYSCKYYKLNARFHWIVLGTLMAAFYVGLPVFYFVWPKLLLIGFSTTNGLIAVYGLAIAYFLYQFFALFITKEALLEKLQKA